MRTVSNMAAIGADAGIRDVVLACGVFDGVHRGHRRIIVRLLQLAEARHGTPVVVTFEPHPRAVLQPDRAPDLLTAWEQKCRLLAEAGVGAVVALPFTRALAATEAELFLRRHLLGGCPRIRGVCVGADWRFGAGGQGDVALLRRVGRRHGFPVVTVPEFRLYGKPVSSTRIRDAVQQGRLRYAARLLGRPHTVYGRIGPGRGLGSRLFHCPTANLAGSGIVLPPAGVYVARARLEPNWSETVDGVAYIGRSPTLQEAGGAQVNPLVLELHLLDLERDLYGLALEVEPLVLLRPERTFASKTDLRDQIRIDLANARQCLHDSRTRTGSVPRNAPVSE